MSSPAPWVLRYASLVPPGPVLDLACGDGRNGRLFLEGGYKVTFVDRDTSRLSDLADNTDATILEYHLEDESPWPFEEAQFCGIVVVNYLHRPLFPHLAAALKPGGVLIYQTFMAGNERFGKPRNPDFLLEYDELLDVFGESMEVIAFEQGFLPDPDRVVQSICVENR